MSNGILSLLLGLGGGYLQGSQQRQQQAEQDQDRQRRNQLQDLQIADMQRRAQQSQMAPYLSDLDHASAHYSQNPDALSQLSQRKAGLLNGGLQVTGADAPAQGPNFAAGTGPIPVKPRTLASTLSGLNLGQSDQQRQADATQRNAVTGKLFGDLNDFEHPEAIGQAITALNSGAKLGSMVPGRVVTEQKDLPENASSVGFEGNIPPSLPPNTVDLADVYQRAGRTKAQLHEDEMSKRQAAREAAVTSYRKYAADLRSSDVKTRADAGTYNAAFKSEFDASGDVEKADQAGRFAAARGQGPEAPRGAAPFTDPSAGALLAPPPVKTKGMQQGELAGAKAGDAAAAAADRKARTDAYVASVKNTKDYREKTLTLRKADQEIRKGLGNRRINVQQAAQSWRQVVDAHKDALKQWEEENAAALKGPKADPVLTQRATLLRQRIGRLEGQINSLQRAGNDGAAKNLYPNLDNLNREFNSLVGGGQKPAPALTPRPSMQGDSGIPALPRATAQNLFAPSGGGSQQERASYRASLKKSGATDHEINVLTQKRYGGG